MYMDRNHELWKISVNDFGKAQRQVEQSTKLQGLHKNKSAQLNELESHHHQKQLADIITEANDDSYKNHRDHY
ncbi:hypothetical protein KYX90_13315, partial [Enterococcus lactis]|nr:hypothetical protein [Enterococcus lactis]